MRLFATIFLFAAAALAQSKAPQATTLVNTGQEPMLPTSFSGWEKQKDAVKSKDANIADTANAAALKEFSFTDSESATYLRDGRKLTLRALRFNDTTGAYAAFDFYRKPGMLPYDLCDAAAHFERTIIFRCTNMFVTAEFEQLSGMSASELRNLVKTLPKLSGSRALPPKLPLYLPDEFLAAARFSSGPVSFAKTESAVPAVLADFSLDTEAVTANFNTADGSASFTVLSYPTPQLAMMQFKKFEAWQQSQADKARVTEINRSGPLVSIVSGHVTAGYARKLVEKVNYQADVTWNQNTFLSKRDNIGNLVVNIIYLSFIICGLAIVSGIAFGGFRILAHKYFPGRLVDRTEAVEFIRLNLDK